jgi:hypothetical protein
MIMLYACVECGCVSFCVCVCVCKHACQVRLLGHIKVRNTTRKEKGRTFRGLFTPPYVVTDIHNPPKKYTHKYCCMHAFIHHDTREHTHTHTMRFSDWKYWEVATNI